MSTLKALEFLFMQLIPRLQVTGTLCTSYAAICWKLVCLSQRHCISSQTCTTRARKPLRSGGVESGTVLANCRIHDALAARSTRCICLVAAAPNHSKYTQEGLTHSEECPIFGSCPGVGHHDLGVEQACAAMNRLKRMLL